MTETTLTQLMGASSHGFNNPKHMNSSWTLVAERLSSHPKEAAIIYSYWSLFPLQLALMNELFPAPSDIILNFFEAYPDAFDLRTLKIACGNPHIPPDTMKTLLDLRPHLAAEIDHDGSLPLHRAVACGNIDTVRALVACHPRGLMQRNSDHELPLHIACHPQHPKRSASSSFSFRVVTVRLLIEEGIQRGIFPRGWKGGLLDPNSYGGVTPMDLVVGSLSLDRFPCGEAWQTYAICRATLEALERRDIHCNDDENGNSNHSVDDANDAGNLYDSCPSFSVLRALVDYVGKQSNLPPTKKNKSKSFVKRLKRKKKTRLLRSNSLKSQTSQVMTAMDEHHRVLFETLLTSRSESPGVSSYEKADDIRDLFHYATNSGITFGNGLGEIIRGNPEALAFVLNVESTVVPRLLNVLNQHCGLNTVFQLVRQHPDLMRHQYS